MRLDFHAHLAPLLASGSARLRASILGHAGGAHIAAYAGGESVYAHGALLAWMDSIGLSCLYIDPCHRSTSRPR